MAGKTTETIPRHHRYVSIHQALLLLKERIGGDTKGSAFHNSPGHLRTVGSAALLMPGEGAASVSDPTGTMPCRLRCVSRYQALLELRATMEAALRVPLYVEMSGCSQPDGVLAILKPGEGTPPVSDPTAES
jgi:hypothetical protein